MQQSNNDISLESTNAHEHLIQVLSSVLLQLHSLQTLLRNNETPPDLNAIRNGLSSVEQMTQEALDEIRQQSNARKLRFTLSYARDEMQMSIEDDGVMSLPNTDEEQPLPHFQNDRAATSTVEEVPLPHFKAEDPMLLSPYNALHQRLEHLGGSLEVTSQVEQGTRVQVRVPYSNPNAAAVLNGTATNALAHTEEISASAKIHVLIVDDQAVSRAGLHRLLESYPGLQVVGEAADGVQAVSETLELGPQVVLLDANLPNGQSMEA